MSEEMLDYGEMKNNLLVYKSKEQVADICIAHYKEIERLNNIIKELNDKIEDDKMIIEGNWGCIDNLKKDYNLYKNIIKEVREYIGSFNLPKDLGHLGEAPISISELKHILEILDKENKND